MRSESSAISSAAETAPSTSFTDASSHFSSSLIPEKLSWVPELTRRKVRARSSTSRIRCFTASVSALRAIASRAESTAWYIAAKRTMNVACAANAATLGAGPLSTESASNTSVTPSSVSPEPRARKLTRNAESR